MPSVGERLRNSVEIIGGNNMSTKPYITTDEIRQIRELYASGLTIVQVAGIVGRSYYAVKGHVRVPERHESKEVRNSGVPDMWV